MNLIKMVLRRWLTPPPPPLPHILDPITVEKLKPAGPSWPPDPSPREEATAILEFVGWNFPAAYRWIETMHRTDPEHLAFWQQVSMCVEILEAGKISA